VSFTVDQQRRMFRQQLHGQLSAIVAALRQACHLPSDVWPEQRLRDHTQAGIDEAVRNGMRTGEDVLGYLSLRHSVSERFAEFPAVRNHLARTDLPEQQRMHHLFQSLPLGIWSIIRRRLPNPWYAPAQASPDDPEDAAVAHGDDYWSALDGLAGGRAG
jgi:hypothetical protein